jgi:murein DD-endopeptidase MepM/ murein hydrolase activator NlpD
MIAGHSSWGSKLFPTIHLSIQTGARSSQMVLQPAAQAVGLAVMLILAGGLGYLAIRCVAAERMAAASRAVEMQVERANLDLQDAIAALQDKLGAVIRDRAQIPLQRMGTTQQQLAAEPRTAAHEPAGQSVPALGRRALDEVERVLASTGLGRLLLTKLDRNEAEGGLFVPLPKGGELPDAISPQQLLALRDLAKILPTSLPLADYRLTSLFGIRRDPLNRRAAFHTGIDLAAPYMTPVYATAPGTVDYAGWRGGYGKVVEIDLGDGITTRYAHLHRYTVLVGQRIAAQTQIGFVGSTGRSTGPHLHYEVLVNGNPQDPEKFISLAGLIPVATP